MHIADLREAAISAASRAYCPYSRFSVGAAVLADGKIFTGCNIENASFGLTICAERVAVFHAISSGARRIDAIVIVCPNVSQEADKLSRMPCGACRQVMAEFASSNFQILVDGVGEFRLADLLPSPFTFS